MNRAFKVGIYSGSAALLVAVFLAVALTFFIFGRFLGRDQPTLSRQNRRAF